MLVQQSPQRTAGRAPHPGLRSLSMPLFLTVALVGAWLVVTPVWLAAGGAAEPGMVGYAGMAMMLTPSLAVLAIWLRARRRHNVTIGGLARRTGLTLGPRKGRTLGITVATLVGIPILAGMAIAGATASGLAHLNPTGLSGWHDTLTRAGIPQTAITPALLAVAAIVATPISVLPLLPTAFAEEWGWRGFLLPRLAERYSTRVAIAISGAIWGLWHAPLGLFFGQRAPLYFIPLCTCFVVFAALLGWTRLTTGSIWPAVVGHAALNASAATVLLAVSPAAPPNIGTSGIVAMAAWIMFLAIATALLFRWARPAITRQLPQDPR